MALLASLVGCATTNNNEVKNDNSKSNESSSVKSNNEVKNDVVNVVDKKKESQILSFNQFAKNNAIYFDFDKSDVKNKDLIEEYVDLIDDLEDGSSVTLNGYCDNRGSVEYNRKLGMRRALAVKKALEDAGVDKEIKIVLNSFGKDKYKIYTKDAEANYQANRKVELVASK